MANSRSILIVDDDEDSRSMVRTILESNSFEVEECESGKECLERLQSYTPSLILLDIMMPEMSGYDVLVAIKQKPETQNIPVIMLTAKGEPEDLITGYKDYGVEYYITKPFTTRQLLAGIKLVLG
jgi:two-component system, OmpR family, phosphate regulon response regulator PhoB